MSRKAVLEKYSSDQLKQAKETYLEVIENEKKEGSELAKGNIIYLQSLVEVIDEILIQRDPSILMFGENGEGYPGDAEWSMWVD
jgi:hypothetical protein